MKRAILCLVVMLVTVTVQAEVAWNDEWGCSADGSGCAGENGMLTPGTSTAPRMESCVSGFGCEKCVLTQPYWIPTCGTEPGEGGSCTCKADPDSSAGCKLEGKCTFRR